MVSMALVEMWYRTNASLVLVHVLPVGMGYLCIILALLDTELSIKLARDP